MDGWMEGRSAGREGCSAGQLCFVVTFVMESIDALLALQQEEDDVCLG